MSYEGPDDDEELKPIPVANNNKSNNNVVSDSNSDDNIEKDQNVFNKDINDKVKVTPQNAINAKEHAMKKLQALHNNDANNIITQATKEKSAIKNLRLLDWSGHVDQWHQACTWRTKTFNGAWDHPNKNSGKKWQEAIHKEVADMNKQQVWHMTCKSVMPGV